MDEMDDHRRDFHPEEYGFMLTGNTGEAAAAPDAAEVEEFARITAPKVIPQGTDDHISQKHPGLSPPGRRP